MKTSRPIGEQAELLILPNGQVLAHNITPEVARMLSELQPDNELISLRAVKDMPASTLPEK